MGSWLNVKLWAIACGVALAFWAMTGNQVWGLIALQDVALVHANWPRAGQERADLDER